SFKKQNMMLKCIMAFHDKAMHAVDIGVQLKRIQGVPARTSIGRMKEISEAELPKFSELIKEIESDFAQVAKK
ncbi:MAG: hypothetical protein WC488_05335, partial [Candidatus Micrarchaeia archaeon]